MSPRFGLLPLALLVSLYSSSLWAQAGKAINVEPAAGGATSGGGGATSGGGGGQRWALIVGINGYANVPPLRFARQDAETLARTLIEKAGFPKDSVVLMTDGLDGKSPRSTSSGGVGHREPL